MKYHSPNLLSTSTLEGDEVRNPEGEKLGTIEDIMINVDDGCIAYAVLSFGGFLGMGDKLFAVPWETLRVDTNEECFVLNVEKEKLEKAPGFDKDHWPNMADPTFQEQIYGHYGYQRPAH